MKLSHYQGIERATAATVRGVDEQPDSASSSEEDSSSEGSGSDMEMWDKPMEELGRSGWWKAAELHQFGL